MLEDGVKSGARGRLRLIGLRVGCVPQRPARGHGGHASVSYIRPPAHADMSVGTNSCGERTVADCDTPGTEASMIQLVAIVLAPTERCQKCEIKSATND